MKAKNHIHSEMMWLVVWAAVLLFFPACNSSSIQKTDDSFHEWRIRAEQSKGYSPSARKPVDMIEEKQSEIAPEEPEIQTPERPLPTERISLKMHNTDVAVVLRALARAVNQNIIINESITGLVNINIDNAPWDAAFQSILQSLGFSYTWKGDIITIVSPEDRAKGLEQLEVEEQIQTKKKEIERVESFLTKVVPVNFADPNNLKENLETFLTEKAEGKSLGSIMVDKHNNALIIQAIPNDMEKIIPLIAELDKPIPQILIEAHIVETTSDTARELGIQWGGLYHGTEGGDNYWITPGNDAGIGITPGTGGTIDPASGYAVNLPATLPDGTKGLSLGYVAEDVGENILTIQLTAMQKDGKLNILSNPSITTLDNQLAIIESGKEVPFQTVEDQEVKIEFRKAVLSLKVTPHVIDEKTLKLTIDTHKDELDFSNQVQGNPTIITKNAQTSVILFDGQTTVIGGLNKETSSGTETGVPGLKDIPLVGNLFKSQSSSKDMEEVLIFITPHILKERPGTAMR